MHESLPAMLAELRERQVALVRVALAIQSDRLGAPGIPRFTSRVVVTARLDERCWAEWRLWVGRALAEVDRGGFRPPERLRRAGEEAFAKIRGMVAGMGFRVQAGLIASEAAGMDVFRL